MLFNSYFFILIFLPIVLIGFYSLGEMGRHRIAICWLIISSLFFYGWWNPLYLWLIAFSMTLNFIIGAQILYRTQRGIAKKTILICGITANLVLLGYFKYGNFFVENFNTLFKNNIILENIILPLAISFFTFQQITYLIDTYRGQVADHNFLHYSLFVTFFPQLIAGPIVHHREMLPQFLNKNLYKLRAENLSIGLTVFLIGLFKKVILADGISKYATPVFNAAEFSEYGVAISFFEAWGGALAYTFQLYFDFSGYSDMAMGLARMFGIILPINFFSPYKAKNIKEFWKRWHITLSRFFSEYVYIPLGGNKNGIIRTFINLMTTMLLGGLWHGAGWTFILWGGMHGLFLIINHGWQYLKVGMFGTKKYISANLSNTVGRAVTFIAVIFAWVLFRAESIEGAINIYEGMLGFNGFSFHERFLTETETLNAIFGTNMFRADGFGAFGYIYGYLFIFILFIITMIMPNTIEFMRKHVNHETKIFIKFEKHEIPKAEKGMCWNPNLRWTIYFSIIGISCLIFLMKTSEFLYFNF